MRLIDADALTRHKQLEAMGNGKYEDVEVVYTNDIDNAPTIDAVPVVRCKDCKWRYQNQQGDAFCINPHGMGDKEYWVNDNWYCHHGEREDDEIDRR